MEFNKEIEILKKVLNTEIIEMKILICQIRISLESLTNRKDGGEHRLSGLANEPEELKHSDHDRLINKPATQPETL